MGPAVLLAGVDTLAVGFEIAEFKLTAFEWEALANAKNFAGQGGRSADGVPVTFRGRRFVMKPKGATGYEYLLENDDVAIKIAARAGGGSSFPEVYVTFRQSFLWRFGWQSCFMRTRQWIDEWAHVVGEKVSRVDLCIDIPEALPDISIRAGEVVSRARGRKEFYIQHHLDGLDETGYVFGKGDALGRVYDKRAEISKNNKGWFEDIWRRRGWDGVSPVTRIEFQVRRDFIKDMQIESAADLADILPDMWRYFTDEWLSLRDASTDTNRSRWQVKPFWRTVASALHSFGIVAGVRRVTQRKPRVDALVTGLRGYAVSLAALVVNNQAGKRPREGRKWVREKLREFMDDDEFLENVEARSYRFATMPDPPPPRSVQLSMLSPALVRH